MVMTYEQWNLILGVIDQGVDLSKDNVIERIKKLLKGVKIPGQEETLLHELEVSSKIPRVQETQEPQEEPLKKRLKVVNILPAGSEETIEKLREKSKEVYREWEKTNFDVNYYFAVDYLHERVPCMLSYLASDFKLNNLTDALFKVEGTKVETLDLSSQQTSLHLATERGNTRVSLELLRRGANVDTLDSSQRTGLYQPAINGDIETIKVLVQHNVNVNLQDPLKLTVLYEAARHGQKEVVKFLIENGAAVSGNGDLKLTALHVAVADNNKAMVDDIIESDKNIGETIEAVDAFGWTPLHWAAANNNIPILEALLKGISKYEASVDIEDKLLGRSPLHIAATNGNIESVALLINYGTNVNCKDTWGWTPFDCAVFTKKSREVINYLIANKSNIETHDPQKILLFIQPDNYLEAVANVRQLKICKHMKNLIEAHFLRLAARNGDIRMVYDLLASGVNANASDDLKSTALHKAAKYNHSEIVKILLLYRANVNAQNELGECPLSYAFERKNWIVVMILLCYGANPLLTNHCGETVKILAECQGTSDLLMEAEKGASTILTQLGAQSRMMEHTASPMLRKTKLSSSFESMIRDNANHITQLQYRDKINHIKQLQYNAKFNEIGTNTKACPAEMDGVKEQILHSPCRWSYHTKNVAKKEVINLANNIKNMNLQPNTYFSEIKELSVLTSSVLTSSVIERYRNVIKSPPSFS